jgi:hypothetical protein
VREDGLGDFLRVILDIRLPFVAFSRSIIGLLRVLSWRTEIESGCRVSLMAAEDGYKEFDAPPVRSLNVLLKPDNE